MRARRIHLVVGAIVVAALGGCAGTPRGTAQRPAYAGTTLPPAPAAPAVTQASATATPAPTGPRRLTLNDAVALTLARNPRLAQVTWAVEAARGRAVQAGLYPNPTVTITGDELGDRTGPAGIWSAPTVSQEIVTGNKLGLSRAAAVKEMDQATLELVAERFQVLTEVRQSFLEVVATERRVKTLTELVALAEQSVKNSERLLAAKEAARLDVVQLEVDLERYRADMEAATRALPAAYRRLSASIGVESLGPVTLEHDLDVGLPAYDLERVRGYVLASHPDVRSAEIGVERARLLLQRAEAEPVPNVTVSAGYVYQDQNRSNDWMLGVSVPLPVWNKNEGNIAAAHAQLHQTAAGVDRVRNDLTTRVATAFGAYAAARERAERYRTAILPRARETLELSQKAYQGGQFEYLRVLQAQRSVAEANVEYVRTLGEVWRAAAELGGITLDDAWPLTPAVQRRQP